MARVSDQPARTPRCWALHVQAFTGDSIFVLELPDDLADPPSLHAVVPLAGAAPDRRLGMNGWERVGRWRPRSFGAVVAVQTATHT